MLIQGNALHIPLRDKSVQCVVTSPPYYGLRDYSVENQLGLEPTLEEYIQNTVLWVREVRRVLKDGGTLWLNLGDSFAGSGKGGNQERFRHGHSRAIKPGETYGYKPKDLMMVPHRVAIALQNDGWWVRSDIVWNKPNPMPESVTDRPTKAHEYIFLLSKSKNYFYDADAVREERTTSEGRPDGIVRDREYEYVSKQGVLQGRLKQDEYEDRRYVGFNKRWDESPTTGRSKRSVWEYDEDEFLQFLKWKEENSGEKTDIWTMTTKPYSGSHFATFPPELPETCIKAGTSEKGECPECGKAWVRVTNPTKEHAKRIKNYRVMAFDGIEIGKYIKAGLDKKGWTQSRLAEYFPSQTGGKTGCAHNWITGKNIPTAEQWKTIKDVLDLGDRFDLLMENPATGELKGWDEQDMLNFGMKGAGDHIPTGKITLGWKPQCNCNRDPVPQIVLDPFAGSGTTVMVANALGRKGIGIDLSWDYLQLAKERTGMKAMDEWISGKKAEANLEGLPMFEDL